MPPNTIRFDRCMGWLGVDDDFLRGLVAAPIAVPQLQLPTSRMRLRPYARSDGEKGSDSGRAGEPPVTAGLCQKRTFCDTRHELTATTATDVLVTAVCCFQGGRLASLTLDTVGLPTDVGANPPRDDHGTPASVCWIGPSSQCARRNRSLPCVWRPQPRMMLREMFPGSLKSCP